MTKKKLPSDFKKCPGSLHFTLLIRGLEMLVFLENFAYVLNNWPLMQIVAMN